MSEQHSITSCLRLAHWGPCGRLSCISIWDSYDDEKSDESDNTGKINQKNKKIKSEHTYESQEIKKTNFTQIIPVKSVQKCSLYVAHDGPGDDPSCFFKQDC